MSIKQIFFLSLFIFSFSACNVNLNKDIHIAQGEQVTGSQNTVNGSIIIESNGVVEGGCRSVNGKIAVGNSSRVGGLQTVNGSIIIGANATVNGNVQSVNGTVVSDSSTKIDGDVSTVNGRIELNGTSIIGDITTHNGKIGLRKGCNIEGNVIFKRVTGEWDNKRTLVIEISDESVVKGDIVGEDENFPVKIHLSGTGKVNGNLENAEVVKE